MVDSENDNKSVIYNFEDYILENIATFETERAAVPSITDVMDFPSITSSNVALKGLQIVNDYFLSYKDQLKNLQNISILDDAAF